ncbi:glycosyltransferase WbuB [Silvibacterium dinghuense]|nr:glycosyltransferase WbuB [Silvibacterium dinghuense]
MEWLVEQGHEVRVVTAPPYYPEWKVREGYRWWEYRTEQSSAGVRIYRCPLYVPKRPNGWRRLLHLGSFATSSLPIMLRQLLWRPDIVMTIEPALFCAPTAALMAVLSGASAWLHVQDFEIDAAFDLELLPAGGSIHKFALFYERAIMQVFDRVSTISPNMVRRLTSKGVSKEKAILFPNWVNVDEVTASVPGALPNAYRHELGIRDDQIVLLYSGNLGHKQGLEILPQVAEALRERKDLHFVFCGDGAYRRPLERFAGSLPNVSLLHLQPRARLNELLNAADIHLLPQRADAADLVMPSKLTGMMASGRPVITTAVPGTQLADAVEGCGLVVPPGDVQAFTQAILALADARAERLEMGRTARCYAEEHMGRDYVLRRLEKEMRVLLASGPALEVSEQQ